jgi:hypothetical protein
LEKEKAERWGKVVQITYTHMYINAKMIPVETVLGIGEREDEREQQRR